MPALSNLHKSLSLFRSDAVAYRLNRQQAQALLQHSGWIKPLLWFVSALLLLLVFVLVNTQYRETETARGRVIPVEAEQKLVAPRTAVVNKIFVSRGQQVAKGEVLATLSLSLFDGNGQQLSQSELEILHSEHDALLQEREITTEHYALRLQSLIQQISQKKIQYETAIAALSTKQKQLDIGASLLGGVQTLLAHRSISRAQYDQQQLSQLVKVSQFQQAQQNLQDIEQASQQLEYQLTALDNERELNLARISHRLTALSLQLEQIQDAEQLAILAQRSGVVAAVATEEGDSVEAGQPMIFLQPQQQPLIAEVFVPSRIVGKLAPGQDLMLRYDAFDYQSYGRYPAQISEIETSPLDPREHLLPLNNIAEPVFRVLVIPQQHYVEGEDIYALQSGLLLSADFIVAEMSLIEFIFKPLFSLRGKVA